MSIDECERAVALVGGPYDGDRGTWDVPLPEQLFAYPCRCPGSDRCRVSNRVHWTATRDGDGVPTGVDLAPYKRGDDLTGDPVVYEWDGGQRDTTPLSVREALLAAQRRVPGLRASSRLVGAPA